MPQMQPSQPPGATRRPYALRALMLTGAFPLAMAAQPPSAVAVADSAAMVTVSASALSGVVTDYSDHPLAGAIITAVDRPDFVLTSDKGKFQLGGLLPGRRQFEVRRVGYLPAVFELDVPPVSVVHVRARLQPAYVTLSAIVVDGRRRPLGLWRAGFYDRAVKQVLGYFYPPDEIVRRNLTSVSTVLSEIPGITIQSDNGGHVIPYGRMTGDEPCKLNVWVDDMLTAAADDGLDVIVPGYLVRAIEVYPSITAAPGRYARPGNRCGAIVIWTKGIVY